MLHGGLNKSWNQGLLNSVRFQVAIGDFGLCRILDEGEQKVDGAYGSPMYMSPECLQGFKYDLSSDVYSLGVILYEMVYGNVPYNCNNIEELLS